jgi:hypothetical protein|tara:strand:+ start:86 stop:505 length:420 start_codon:yes stop_codon:yes gene_type:complete
MNLKRKIREELNKTLLNEDTSCADSVEMDCGTWDCTASLHSTDPCKYFSCCNGLGMTTKGKGQTMAEDVVGGGHGTCTSGGRSDGPSCGHCRYPAWHCSNKDCECNQGGKLKKPGDLPNKMERKIAEGVQQFRSYRTRR